MKALMFVSALLGGCAASVANQPVEVGVGDCSAAAAQSLIGQPGTSETAQQALKVTKSKSVRWLRPGMAVTMDYRSDRLNITLDDQNLITRINCG
jgi:Peptidase inhibitor I78 family